MGKRSFLNRLVSRVHVLFALLATGLGLWAYFVAPGVYHGHLHGTFTLLAVEAVDARFVTVDAESASRWVWRDHARFAYPLVRIRVEGGKAPATMDVLFPGPTVRAGGRDEPLSAERFAAFVADGQPALEGQARQLYAFVLAMGRGDARRPRHHPYHVDEPYKGHFTHFAIGTLAFLYLMGTLGVIWAATAVGLWLAKRRQKPTTAN